MKLTVIAAFSWAHRGVQVEHFAEGAEIETVDQDLIDVSQREGWTAPPGKGTATAATAGDDDSPVIVRPPAAPPPEPTEAPAPAPTEAPAPAPVAEPKKPKKK